MKVPALIQSGRGMAGDLDPSPPKITNPHVLLGLLVRNSGKPQISQVSIQCWADKWPAFSSYMYTAFSYEYWYVS